MGSDRWVKGPNSIQQFTRNPNLSAVISRPDISSGRCWFTANYQSTQVAAKRLNNVFNVGIVETEAVTRELSANLPRANKRLRQSGTFPPQDSIQKLEVFVTLKGSALRTPSTLLSGPGEMAAREAPPNALCLPIPIDPQQGYSLHAPRNKTHHRKPFKNTLPFVLETRPDKQMLSAAP